MNPAHVFNLVDIQPAPDLSTSRNNGHKGICHGGLVRAPMCGAHQRGAMVTTGMARHAGKEHFQVSSLGTQPELNQQVSLPFLLVSVCPSSIGIVFLVQLTVSHPCIKQGLSPSVKHRCSRSRKQMSWPELPSFPEIRTCKCSQAVYLGNNPWDRSEGSAGGIPVITTVGENQFLIP